MLALFMGYCVDIYNMVSNIGLF